MRLFIGLMSGTSMDGIDAALVDVDTHRLICGITRPYGELAEQRLRAVLDEKHTTAAALSQLNTLLGREFALAALQLLEQANITSQEVIAIGSHGQTICHDATADIPYTVQLGCAHTIASMTGITVVADFRTRDMVIGGQGAPFAPAYHQTLFGQLEQPTAVVNIGGIANVTFLAQNVAVSGYDTGPGNCMMDAWVKKHLQASFDKNGAWGATCRVNKPLLDSMLADAYFALPAPKSLDKAYFSQEWLAQHLNANLLKQRIDANLNLAAQDVQATLLELTATSICQAIKSASLSIEQVAVCGGGVHNSALMQSMRSQLPSLEINSTQHWGVDPDFLEAMMFAWFADQTIQQIPIDLTGITGAKFPVILGSIYASGS